MTYSESLKYIYNNNASPPSSVPPRHDPRNQRKGKKRQTATSEGFLRDAS